MDLLVSAAAVALLVIISVPMVLHSRDEARRNICRDNLRAFTLALHHYHDSAGTLPFAARWDTNATTSLALHRSKQIDRITRENWALLVLPYTGDHSLVEEYDASRPVGDPANARFRTTSLALMTCPADDFNRDDNRYRFSLGEVDNAFVEFARGNYAINGGSHDAQFDPPDTTSPKGDALNLVMREEPRRFEMWGNGIAGINRSFSLDSFSNGQSTLVALEELRSGVHPLDPRGVWALGQIGGSITWAHGVNGDAFGPNNPWPRADDILGCAAVHEAVGTDALARHGMPCVDYVDGNQQAASRSRHPGGVHVALLDGAVKFIADDIDPGVWHVMHSRDTPADVLGGDAAGFTSFTGSLAEAPPPEPPPGWLPAAGPSRSDSREAGPALENSLGMSFAVIPAGEFLMGLPDAGIGPGAPPECPPHQVRISEAFRFGVHEVSRRQYFEVMGEPSAEGDALHENSRLDAESISNADHPVVHATWHEAEEFCRKLSLLPAERRAGRWYRLPTEAEWEYACRAGDTQPYSWTRHRRPEDASGEAAGIVPALSIQPVGSYATNKFGLHDMRGNAWEWTADWFDRDYYLRSPSRDPRGPANGYIKVVRGGDWRFVGEVCRIDYPVMPPWKANPIVGFRVVCETTAHE
ncbi:MAG: SUMF1/EgtB/PvdO family nonheme iron enzyme [Planctomycetaceae bacterium]